MDHVKEALKCEEPALTKTVLCEEASDYSGVPSVDPDLFSNTQDSMMTMATLSPPARMKSGNNDEEGE